MDLPINPSMDPPPPLWTRFQFSQAFFADGDLLYSFFYVLDGTTTSLRERSNLPTLSTRLFPPGNITLTVLVTDNAGGVLVGQASTDLHVAPVDTVCVCVVYVHRI